MKKDFCILSLGLYNEGKTNAKCQIQNEKGITLMALIITIIVMLILVGVTIGSTLDSDGVFKKSNEAVNDWNTRMAEDADTEKAIWEQELGKREKIQEVNDEHPGEFEGSGTTADPYTINSIEDLVAFAYTVNSGETYLGKTVELGLDLDMQNDKSYANPNEKYSLRQLWIFHRCKRNRDKRFAYRY